MITGLYGAVMFMAGSRNTQTYKNLSRSYPTRWAEHEVHLEKPVLEFTGPGLVEVELTMGLSTSWGINPQVAMAILHLHHTSNPPIPGVLFLGGRLMGPGLSLFVITDLSEDHRYFSRSGILIAADVTVKLKEYQAFQAQYGGI